MQYRKITELKKLPGNPRIIRDKQFKTLCDSIRDNPEYFKARPCILSNRTGELVIIAGNQRYEAAKFLKLKEVPTYLIEGLTEAKEREIVIRDNISNGEFDYDLLANHQWDDLPLVEWGVDLPEDWMGGGKQEATEDDFDADAEADNIVVPITKTGDVWLLGRHRVMCGDSTKTEDVKRLMGGAMADLIVTSPPYNQGIDKFKPSGMHKERGWIEKVERLAYKDSLPEEDYQDKQRELLDVLFENLNTNRSFFYNHKNRYRDKRVISPLNWLPGKFNFRQEIIWSRPGSVTQNARMFLPSDERIYWLYKGDDFLFHDTTAIKSLSTVWDISLETNKDHAVGFPIDLPSRCITACSEAGEIVVDPYCGSGTTLIAAEQLNRICYGMEIDPAYCDVIVKRWETLTGKKAVTESSGA